VLGFRAKAHAALSDQTNFQKSIDWARKVLELSSPDLVQPGIFSFLLEKLAFYEARGGLNWAILKRPHQPLNMP
jgi:hypothetical protein